jgi:NADH:ubiquinone oxidoreductase subunit K
MLLNQFLLLSAFLFCTGIYGVLTRKHTVLVLMSIELMLAAVNINLVAFGALHNAIDDPGRVIGQVFALFVLTIAVTNAIFRVYIIPFEIVGVLLLGALVGAVVLARRD